MSSTNLKLSALVGLAALLISLSGSAQQASGKTYFLTASTIAPGGTSQSTNYKLVGVFGSGVTPVLSGSSKYLLAGGFPAMTEVSTPGRPWITGVRALYAPILGGVSLAVHGSELHSPISAKVGGISAPLVSQARDKVTVTMPAQLSPGWKSVEITTTAGKVVHPQGLGVLPLLALPEPVLSGEAFRITYRGKPGDMVLWMLSGTAGSTPISLPTFHYSFQLDLFSFFQLGVTMTNAQGLSHLDTPAGIPLIRPLRLQTISTTTSTGYSPGGFSNVISL